MTTQQKKVTSASSHRLSGAKDSHIGKSSKPTSDKENQNPNPRRKESGMEDKERLREMRSEFEAYLKLLAPRAVKLSSLALTLIPPGNSKAKPHDFMFGRAVQAIHFSDLDADNEQAEKDLMELLQCTIIALFSEFQFMQSGYFHPAHTGILELFANKEKNYVKLLTEETQNRIKYNESKDCYEYKGKDLFRTTLCNEGFYDLHENLRRAKLLSDRLSDLWAEYDNAVHDIRRAAMRMEKALEEILGTQYIQYSKSSNNLGNPFLATEKLTFRRSGRQFAWEFMNPATYARLQPDGLSVFLRWHSSMEAISQKTSEWRASRPRLTLLPEDKTTRRRKIVLDDEEQEVEENGGGGIASSNSGDDESPNQGIASNSSGDDEPPNQTTIVQLSQLVGGGPKSNGRPAIISSQHSASRERPTASSQPIVLLPGEFPEISAVDTQRAFVVREVNDQPPDANLPFLSYYCDPHDMRSQDPLRSHNGPLCIANRRLLDLINATEDSRTSGAEIVTRASAVATPGSKEGSEPQRQEEEQGPPTAEPHAEGQVEEEEQLSSEVPSATSQPRATREEAEESQRLPTVQPQRQEEEQGPPTAQPAAEGQEEEQQLSSEVLVYVSPERQRQMKATNEMLRYVVEMTDYPADSSSLPVDDDSEPLDLPPQPGDTKALAPAYCVSLFVECCNSTCDSILRLVREELSVRSKAHELATYIWHLRFYDPKYVLRYICKMINYTGKCIYLLTVGIEGNQRLQEPKDYADIMRIVDREFNRQKPLDATTRKAIMRKCIELVYDIALMMENWLVRDLHVYEKMGHESEENLIELIQTAINLLSGTRLTRQAKNDSWLAEKRSEIEDRKKLLETKALKKAKYAEERRLEREEYAILKRRKLDEQSEELTSSKPKPMTPQDESESVVSEITSTIKATPSNRIKGSVGKRLTFSGGNTITSEDYKRRKSRSSFLPITDDETAASELEKEKFASAKDSITTADARDIDEDATEETVAAAQQTAATSAGEEIDPKALMEETQSLNTQCHELLENISQVLSNLSTGDAQSAVSSKLHDLISPASPQHEEGRRIVAPPKRQQLAAMAVKLDKAMKRMSALHDKVNALMNRLPEDI